MYILGRKGDVREFDIEKIEIAIAKAANAVDGTITRETKGLAHRVASEIEKMTVSMTLSVDDIQNLVVDKLKHSERSDIGVAYDNYRRGRDAARKEAEDKIEKIKTEKKQFDDLIREKLEATNVVNANANMDEYSFSGRMGEARNVVTKKYALEMMSEKARKNHEENIIYTHDLDSYKVGLHNCLSIPFDDLLANGVWVRNTSLRPAGSVGTALQLVAVIFQLQSQSQFGGVSATHLDWTLVPYVRKSLFKHYLMEYLKDTEDFEFLDFENIKEDDLDEWVDAHRSEYLKRFGLTKEDFFFGSEKLDKRYYKRALFETRREVYQAAEGMYHNLNTLQSRSGGQLPFTSINYGTCTLPEGRLVIKALLENSIKGVSTLHIVNAKKKGFTPIFPCGIFQCMKYVNRHPGDANYDLFLLALESTSKRLYPNYANVDWSGNAGYDINDPKTYFSTMGCRTANGYDINADEGVNPQTKDGRGNICPVTIILPKLAMMANGNVDKFMEILDETIHEAKDQLIERFEHICSQPVSAAPFIWNNHMMLGYDGKTTRSAFKHGTLAVGQLGLAETLQILIGCDHTEEKGMELAKRIEQLFKDRCAEFKQTYKLNFGVYYTPAENLCYTAMKKFKDEYGEIPNVSDRDYFTNSMHVPVWKEISPFEKIDIESQLTGYSSAGCITYVELDGAVQHNLKALETIVNYAMDHDIPYFAVNVPNDQCIDCGFDGEFNDRCPVCGSTNIMQLRRVTGYLTGNYKTAFNKGKQKEVEDRYKHSRKFPRIMPKIA